MHVLDEISPPNAEPSIMRAHLDVVGDDGDVLEVERRVDLVHDVERRRLVVMQREDERQRAQRLLAARQVRDVLPRLLERPHAVSEKLLPSIYIHV